MRSHLFTIKLIRAKKQPFPGKYILGKNLNRLTIHQGKSHLNFKKVTIKKKNNKNIFKMIRNQKEGEKKQTFFFYSDWVAQFICIQNKKTIKERSKLGKYLLFCFLSIFFFFYNNVSFRML